MNNYIREIMQKTKQQVNFVKHQKPERKYKQRNKMQRYTSTRLSKKNNMHNMDNKKQACIKQNSHPTLSKKWNYKATPEKNIAIFIKINIYLLKIQ